MRKKGHIRDNVKINYTRFMIRLLSRTVILIPYCTRKSLCLVHNYRFYRKMIRDVRWFEAREIYLMKQHKKYEITHTHVSRLTRFLRLTDISRIVYSQLWLHTTHKKTIKHVRNMKIHETRSVCRAVANLESQKFAQS